MDPSVILGRSWTAWPFSWQAKQVVLAFRSATLLWYRFSETSLHSEGGSNERPKICGVTKGCQPRGVFD